MENAFVSRDRRDAEARGVLPIEAYDFISGGAGEEQTLAANEAAFQRIRFTTRILRDVSSIDTAVTIFGDRLAMPVLVAPMGAHRLVHPEGEIGTARAAAQAGVGYITSTAATESMEDLAAEGGQARWFQLYCYRDRGVTEDLVHRAEAADYSALCVTCDAPVLGMRRRDVKNAFRPSPDIRWVNLERYGLAALPNAQDGSVVMKYFAGLIDPTLTWRELEWMAGITRLPVVVKGVLNPEDARLAVEAGAGGVYVSNHGGRQLDRVVATVDALQGVVDAVGDRVPVFIDGGLRSAADVAAAIAMGAAAVAIGRPILWALAIGGQGEVARYLEELHADLVRTLALLGVTSAPALDSAVLAGAPQPSVAR